MKYKIIPFLFSIVFFMATNTALAIPNLPRGKAYNYFDGAGNKYVLVRNVLEYNPIKASESSSGIYDGGTKISHSLTKKQLKEIELMFQKVIDDKSCQTTKNIKPNCFLKIITYETITSFSIIATSKSNINLIEKLKHIKELHKSN